MSIKDLIKDTNYQTGCLDIINHYGENKQLTQLIQECSELIKAVTKGDLYNFIEELADVRVMIDQFTLKYPAIARDVEDYRYKKVVRTLKKISEEVENVGK